MMKIKDVVVAMGALAHENRLLVYRELVQAGTEGVPAGELAERLGIPANTLSFHLRALSHADLVFTRHQGRFIYYSANYDQTNALIEFLTDNCCGGRPCPPMAKPARKRKSV
jgi:DNA-binding transcriptional ArsR family regulator